jgi:uncharacterized membrane protein
MAGAAQPASGIGLADVDRLREAGLLPADRHLAAALAVRNASAWNLWASRALLALGAGQVLAGIIFFFAWNWAGLSPVAKFGIVEGGLALVAIVALIVGLDRPVGQALLIGASVLAGVLFAVIGQVYQTGADAWTLFAAWAALILPFVVISRSAAHWLVWLVVLYLALASYAAQVWDDLDAVTGSRIEVGLGLLTLVFIAARELAVTRGFAWLVPAWTRHVLIFASAVLLFWPAVGYLVYFHHDRAVLLAMVPAYAVLLYVYARVLPDLAAATMVTGFAALCLIATGFYLIEEIIGFTWKGALRTLGPLALMIAWSVAVTGATALTFRRLQRSIA